MARPGRAPQALSVARVPRAPVLIASHSGPMADARAIVIYPPASDGGRRVRAGGRFLGMAYGLLDVVEFLRLAGLENVDDDWVRQTALIEWRGGDAESWGASPGM